ncbi:hypothetical protein DVH05_028457 [Phytophthora capsici]|nr:hypothetical protein DVH05_028457 [Phytophthora capsici]
MSSSALPSAGSTIIQTSEDVQALASVQELDSAKDDDLMSELIVFLPWFDTCVGFFEASKDGLYRWGTPVCRSGVHVNLEMRSWRMYFKTSGGEYCVDKFQKWSDDIEQKMLKLVQERLVSCETPVIEVTYRRRKGKRSPVYQQLANNRQMKWLSTWRANRERFRQNFCNKDPEKRQKNPLIIFEKYFFCEITDYRQGTKRSNGSNRARSTPKQALQVSATPCSASQQAPTATTPCSVPQQASQEVLTATALCSASQQTPQEAATLTALESTEVRETTQDSTELGSAVEETGATSELRTGHNAKGKRPRVDLHADEESENDEFEYGNEFEVDDQSPDASESSAEKISGQQLIGSSEAASSGIEGTDEEHGYLSDAGSTWLDLLEALRQRDSLLRSRLTKGSKTAEWEYDSEWIDQIRSGTWTDDSLVDVMLAYGAQLLPRKYALVLPLIFFEDKMCKAKTWEDTLGQLIEKRMPISR